MPTRATEARPAARERPAPRVAAKHLLAAVIFSLLALAAGRVAPTIEISWVAALLLLTIYLFAFEVVAVDVAAVVVMVLLGLSSLLAPLMGLEKGLVDPAHQMETWSLFSVTPVGLLLLATGIVYFILAGRYVLPARMTEGVTGVDTMAYFRETYGLFCVLYEMSVPADSTIVDKTLDEVERDAGIRVVALCVDGELRIGAGSLARDIGVAAGSVLGVTGKSDALETFAAQYGLQLHRSLDAFSHALSPARAGIAELVIPPGSQLIGKTPRDVALRRTYGISIIASHRLGKTLREEDGIRDIPLQSGDTLVVHTTWKALARLEHNPDFVVVTTEYPHEELRPQKVAHAAAFFALALSLVLFTDLRLSVPPRWRSHLHRALGRAHCRVSSDPKGQGIRAAA